ncbi:MAG: aspartate aminotransferase family protein [Desulfobacula sp.]|jgi:adenosylmethionine-8-amino-7-oxononanoate aminotransferase|uniref:aminotransferase family protein n=1 Tax=Desulfobacula sp. TaxID=2593537 RepID=UPI001D8300BE|nr:aspartate aminotransferase family protein [Desulfobacula sp.]MBT3485153.1 aspartate aminotransferase family protein [Desulfobacula sp.]MBT3804102.1 aspartate aminotransferase family protein [Desulfobacula sp.]MBT4025357.1 aspartate aminotransferase family protein [Desulfobacula sp.]MBT4199491.1 aspartate aminotransferase family protein [Desulfobacula sp.]
MLEIPGNVFHRRLDTCLPMAKSAHGIYIEDENGKKYMDASGGAVVVNAGHGRQTIAKAIYNQVLSHDYIHPTMFASKPVEMLAKSLAKKAPGDINRFYFFSGGSEANEAAIKLARQIHIEHGDETKYRLIGRWKSYHGLTLGSLAAMGRTSFKTYFTPLLKENLHIPAPYCYRCAYGLKYPSCKLRCALALDEMIENAGPQTISAFIAETVPGATIAACFPPKEYLDTIAKICQHHNVLLILDEVMCGMGRTGEFFACNHFDVVPDIVTLGKGLAGGVMALSAFGVKESHFNTIKDNSGGFMHGGTFTHHSVAAAAGLALFEILEKEKLVQRVKLKGQKLGDLLKKHLLPIPQVGDVRGKGFMWGIEIVKDKKTKQPFKRSLKIVEGIWDNLFEKGYIIYKSSGLAGVDGDALVIAPPYIIKDEEMEILVKTIKSSIIEFFN